MVYCSVSALPYLIRVTGCPALQSCQTHVFSGLLLGSTLALSESHSVSKEDAVTQDTGGRINALCTSLIVLPYCCVREAVRGLAPVSNHCLQVLGSNAPPLCWAGPKVDSINHYARQIRDLEDAILAEQQVVLQVCAPPTIANINFIYWHLHVRVSVYAKKGTHVQAGKQTNQCIA